MNEISVIVLQTPGEVSWNYLEIKNRLKEELEVYKKTAYTDDTIKTAKNDIADLRKLAKAIEDRRKEVKEKCLEPYTPIENQAKELIELIEEPIQAINSQVKDYEKCRKEAVRKEILNYWHVKADVLPEDIKDKAQQLIYDERWENATATKKSWKEGIENGIRKIQDEIETIKSFSSEFEEDMLMVYKVDLSLQKAIARMNELKAQQERILEIERKKQEAEQRRKEAEERQRQEAEERRRQQEELKRKSAESMDGMMPPPVMTNPTGSRAPVLQETPGMGQPENTGNAGVAYGNIPHREEPARMGQPEAQTKAYPGGRSVRLIITGTQEQITKIQNYIRFAGATYQEV